VRSPAEGLSLGDMKAIAREAGLDPVLVEQAARLTDLDSGRSRLEKVLGGPLKVRRGGDFDTTLTAEKAAYLLAVVQAAAEQQGEGGATPSGLSWHSVGEGTQYLVTVHAEGTGSRVRIVADRRTALAITGTFTGLATLATAIGILVVGEAGGIQSLPLGLGIMGTGVAAVLGAGRTIWKLTSRAASERVDQMMGLVARSLEKLATDERAEGGEPETEG
jgi:hypothetical protein